MNGRVTGENKTWLRLDNAAKIYPAAKSRRWKALFRLSATLDEPVDPELLYKAQQRTLHRIAGFSYRLRAGMFWYYLEKMDGAPDIQDDVRNPCAAMSLKQNKGFAFRVRYYNNRIAVEIFHALTDGTGGLTFLKTLVAEYLRMKYNEKIPYGDGILDCSKPPKKEELEDSFLKYSKSHTVTRQEPDSFYIRGEREDGDMVNITTGIIDVGEISSRAKEMKVTVTEYIAAVLVLSGDELQRRAVSEPSRWKPLKVNIPVNLRRFFPSTTLRNFSSYVNAGIDPRLGDFTLKETARNIHYTMRMEANEKMLNAKFTTNVKTEKNKLLRVVPLFLKNAVMKAAFLSVGDRKSFTSISNLGGVTLPPEMAKHVSRLEFILGPLARNRICCAAIGYNGKIYINFTRTIKSKELERLFFTKLVELGTPVLIESNRY